MRIPNFVFLCLALAVSAGCAGDPMGPVKTTPPAAYLMIRGAVDLIASATDPERRASFPVAERKGADRRAAGRCHYSGSAMIGNVANDAIMSMAARQAEGGEEYDYRGYEMPGGKYPLAGEDSKGFYYKAPFDIAVDNQDFVPGGIYWLKSTPVPDHIYLVYKRGSYPGLVHLRTLSQKVMIPGTGRNSH